MSIWTQLQRTSETERDLLNRAMVLLQVVTSNYKLEDHIKRRITELEEEVNVHQKNDCRFRRSAVVFDLDEYPRTKA